MTMNKTRRFARLSQATGTKKGRYIGEGVYDLAIKEVRMVGRGQNFFCVTMIVLATDGGRDDRGEVFEVGDEAVYMTDLDLESKYPGMVLGNIKDFLRAAVPEIEDELEDEEKAEEHVEEAVGPDQPLRGMVVHSNAVDRPRDSGGTFTYPNFEAVDESVYERYAEQLEELVG